ncbi:hypothetical protein [Microbacterium sp. LWH12-1.2]|uniref:hypothetical protein n=1 Tax=Microbacterium sp. LWH12-1.2 TaxID=3135259 RepID=UPI00342C5EBA
MTGQRGRKKRDVADLKFSGGRFEGKGYPLDGIDELQKYQRLVVEVAKQIWWAKHPDRLRLPARFDERVRLRLTSIREGSVVPTLEREAAIALPGMADLLDLSIAYIDEAFTRIVADLEMPTDASDETKKLLKGFGGSLRAKEEAVFRAHSATPIRYDQKKRKAFLSSLGEPEAAQGTLIGKIRMLDAGNEFTIEDGLGRKVHGAFSTAAIFDDLLHVLTRKDDADLIWLDCQYVLDQDEAVKKILDVRQAGLFAKSDNEWAQRLAKIATYRRGWLDGEGEPADLAALEAALSILNSVSEQSLAKPSIFAEEDGGVRLEWLTSVSHSVLSVNNDAVFSAYHLNVATGEESDADAVVGAEAALNFIHGYISA